MLQLVENLAFCLAGTSFGLLSCWFMCQRARKSLQIAHDASLAQLRQTLEEQRQLTSTKSLQVADKFDSMQSELSMREAELNLMALCDNEFVECDSSVRVYDAMLRICERSLQPEFTISALFSPEDPPIELCISMASPREKGALALARSSVNIHELLDRNTAQVLPADQIRELDQYAPNVKFVAYVPVACRHRRFGYLCLFIVSNDYHEKLRLLRRAVTSFARHLFRITAQEEESVASRTDHLTGLPNNKSLEEIVPPLLNTASDEFPVSLIRMECDNLKQINDQYGHLVGDQMIIELVQVIQKSIRIEQLNISKRPPDQFYRYGGLQFVAVLPDTNAIEAGKVAERIRSAVGQHGEWPGGVPGWSITCAVVTSPTQGNTLRELLLKAEVTLMYLREKGGNDSMNFDHVPRSYSVSKLSARVGGSLDIFDPAIVIRSVANTGKSGILTVRDSYARTFSAFYQDGTMKKARLVPYRGDNAVIEFLSTFEEGDFEFREYNQLDSDSLKELHLMDDTFNVVKTVDESLRDGALAQDHLAAARRLIPNNRLFARPTKDAQQRIIDLSRKTNEFTFSELETMASICKYVNGRNMLDAILSKLDQTPTYLKWRASAILVEYKAIELSKIGISSMN